MPLMNTPTITAGKSSSVSTGIPTENMPYYDVIGGAVLNHDVGITMQGKNARNKAYTVLKPWNEVVGMLVKDTGIQMEKEGYTKESENVYVKSIGKNTFDVRTINPQTGEILSNTREIAEPDPVVASAYKDLKKVLKDYVAAENLGSESSLAYAKSLEPRIASYGNTLFRSRGIPANDILQMFIQSPDMSKPTVTESGFSSQSIDKNAVLKGITSSTGVSTGVSNGVGMSTIFGGTPFDKAFNNKGFSSQISNFVDKGNVLTESTKTTIKNVPNTKTANDVSRIEVYGINKNVSRDNLTNSTSSSVGNIFGPSGSKSFLNKLYTEPIKTIPQASNTSSSYGFSSMTQGFSSINPFLNTTGADNFSNIINSDIGKSRRILPLNKCSNASNPLRNMLHTTTGRNRKVFSVHDKLKSFGVRV